MWISSRSGWLVFSPACSRATPSHRGTTLTSRQSWCWPAGSKPDAFIDASIRAAISRSLMQFSGKFEASFMELQMLNHEEGAYKSLIFHRDEGTSSLQNPCRQSYYIGEPRNLRSEIGQKEQKWHRGERESCRWDHGAIGRKYEEEKTLSCGQRG